MDWRPNFQMNARFQGSGGLRGNHWQLGSPQIPSHMNSFQGQFRHPKPPYLDNSPRPPYPRAGFDNFQNYQHSATGRGNFSQQPYQSRPGILGFCPRFNQHQNPSSPYRQWKQPKPRFKKFDDKFDIKKYFKESMLEDPWKKLIQNSASEEEEGFIDE